MGPDPTEFRLIAGEPNDVIHGLAGKLRLTLGQEQPSQIIFPGGKISFDGPQLVAGNGCSTLRLFFSLGHP